MCAPPAVTLLAPEGGKMTKNAKRSAPKGAKNATRGAQRRRSNASTLTFQKPFQAHGFQSLRIPTTFRTTVIDLQSPDTFATTASLRDLLKVAKLSSVPG